MLTLRKRVLDTYLARRILAGAIGAELASSFTWAALCLYWLRVGPPLPFGFFFKVFSGRWAYVTITFYLIVGLLHLVTLALQPKPNITRLRRLAIVPQVGMWAGVTYDLWRLGSFTSVLSFLPITIGLFIAVLRTPLMIEASTALAVS